MFSFVLGLSSAGAAQDSTDRDARRARRIEQALAGIAENPFNAWRSFALVIRLEDGPQAVARLTPYLRHGDGEVRGWAAQYVLKAGGDRKLVLPLLADSEGLTRELAGVALIKDGVDYKVVTPLLKDSCADTRSGIAEALLRAGADIEIARPLLRDTHVDVRVTVAIALIQQEVAESVVLPLLKDPSPMVRKTVAWQLINRGSKTENLYELLRDEHPDVCDEVAEVLLDNGADADRIRFLLQHKHDSVKARVALAMVRNRCEPLAEPVLVLVAASEELPKLERVLRSLGSKTREQIVPTLLQWLVSDDHDRRRVATQTLWSLDRLPVSAFKPLVQATRHPKPDVRRDACELLGHLESVPAEIDAVLTKCLQGPATQHAAIEVCVALRRTAVVSALRDLFESDNVDTRLEAAAAVVRLDPEDNDCVSVIVATSSVKTPTHGTLRALVQSGRQVPVDFLKTAMSTEPNPNMFSDGPANESNKLALFERFGPKAVGLASEWLSEPNCSTHLQLRLIDWAAGTDDNITPLVPMLIPLLQNNDESVRMSILSALETVPEFDVIAVVPLAKTRAGEEQAAAIRLLGHANTHSRPAAIECLEGLLEDDKRRVLACEVLIRLDTDSTRRAFSVLASALDQATEPHEVEAVVNVLSQLESKRALSIVEEYVETKGSDQLPVPMLAWFGPSVIPLLLEGLKNDNPQTRVHSVEALAEIGDHRVAKHIVPLLRDDEYYWHMIGNDAGGRAPVQVAAARALAKLLPDPPLTVQFVRMLYDDSVRAEAADALAAIGPKASSALPRLNQLLRAPRLWGAETASLARAVVRIETRVPAKLEAIRIALREETSRWVAYDQFPYGIHPTIDLIVELGDQARPLIPDLAHFVEGQEVLHPNRRAEAAYALAVLEPANKKWRAYLERWAADWNYYPNPARERLEQLEKRQGSKLR